jgi:hypothetical protein
MDKLFSLHMDKMTAIKMLPDEQVGKVIKLLIEYQEKGVVRDVDPEIAFPYEILRQSLQALNEKREATSEKQRNRVNSRWPKSENNTTEYRGLFDDTTVNHGIPGNTTEGHGIPDDTGVYRAIPKHTNTEKETDTDKEKENSSSFGSAEREVIADTKTNHKKPKPKKLPLREREPDNDMERVEKVYLQNWDTLFSRGQVETQEPIINWNQTRALLKQNLARLKPEQIIQALNIGLKDEWIMSNGYSLGVMLSATVLNRLINTAQGESLSMRKKQEKPSLEGD